jgi:GTPase SAR1 family protein
MVNIEEKWVPEIQQHCPGVPIILLCLKTDLRNDPETKAMLRLDHGWQIIMEQLQNLYFSSIFIHYKNPHSFQL